MQATAISDDVLSVLQRMSFDGPQGVITDTLDRSMYLKVNKVLAGLGGTWNRKAGAHLFEGCARTAVLGAADDGEYVDEKKAYQFFETPDSLADEMVDMAGFRPGDVVLEPSAGKGAIVRSIRRVGGIPYVVELNDKFCRHLQTEELVLTLINGDFLEQRVSTLGMVDAVVMNPPFTKGQDMQHVAHAWQFLKIGGTLVSVMSPHWTFADRGIAVRFRQWSERVDGEWDPLSDGTFKESGTGVNTGLFTATKNAQNANYFIDV